MGEIAIRAATEADRDIVMALFEELERAQGRFRIYPVSPHAGERLEASFRDAMVAPDECWLIAHDAENAVVGMAHCRVERPSKLADARVVEIGRVVVVQGARGRGVGRALVRAAQDFARERGITDLSARIFAGNDESVAFWRALGFEPFVETLVRRGDG